MKISEVINELQEIQNKYGDLFVRIGLGDLDVSFKSSNLNVYGDLLYIE